MRCKCGCEETSTDPSGCVYCKNCGEIIEENFFSNSEVTFAKESDGSSTRIGRFIGYGGNRGSNPNAMTCSREFTINRGRSRIATLGSLLRIENTYIEEAQRLFKLAVYNAEDPNSSGFIKANEHLPLIIKHYLNQCYFFLHRAEKQITSRQHASTWSVDLMKSHVNK